MSTHEHKFEVWQDGMRVAVVTSANREDALRDGWHYLAMYAQDGRAELREGNGRRSKVIAVAGRATEGTT